MNWHVSIQISREISLSLKLLVYWRVYIKDLFEKEKPNGKSVQVTDWDSNRECHKFDQVGKHSSSTKIITANNFIASYQEKALSAIHIKIDHTSLPNLLGQTSFITGINFAILFSLLATNTQVFLQSRAPPYSGEASPKIGEGQNVWFQANNTILLRKRLPKHKNTIFSKNFGGAAPLLPPGYAYAPYPSGPGAGLPSHRPCLKSYFFFASGICKTNFKTKIAPLRSL